MAVEVSAAGINAEGTFYPWATISRVSMGPAWEHPTIVFADGSNIKCPGLEAAMSEYEERSKSGG